ncbi:unnamed protein product [Didymodactylos carnosus]|uniref:Uncharacterized protein n=1 Tax=Didymodactylos carnosus TaxID=1234261 RepID=A0A814G684_9BILA|nr:unnamed protein product [Didymodactylos carnosus]CAF3761602.1 unnamed protein product [Didymodactylos carnosus]
MNIKDTIVVHKHHPEHEHSVHQYVVKEKGDLHELNNEFRKQLVFIDGLEKSNYNKRQQLMKYEKTFVYNPKKKSAYDDLLKQYHDRINQKDGLIVSINRCNSDREQLLRQIQVRSTQTNIPGQNLLEILKQELEGTIIEMNILEQTIKHEDMDIVNTRKHIESLKLKLTQLKNEYDNYLLIIADIENNVNVLNEKLSFTTHLHLIESNEIKKLSLKPNLIDINAFFNDRKQRIIQIFESFFIPLSSIERSMDMEYVREFYNKKKHDLILTKKNVIETTNINDIDDRYVKDRKVKLLQLQDDRSKLTLKLNELEGKYDDTKHAIDINKRAIHSFQTKIANVVKHNVSLRFEIEAYRALLQYLATLNCQSVDQPREVIRSKVGQEFVRIIRPNVTDTNIKYYINQGDADTNSYLNFEEFESMITRGTGILIATGQL